jgi:hypothetical protein
MIIQYFLSNVTWNGLKANTESVIEIMFSGPSFHLFVFMIPVISCVLPYRISWFWLDQLFRAQTLKIGGNTNSEYSPCIKLERPFASSCSLNGRCISSPGLLYDRCIPPVNS